MLSGPVLLFGCREKIICCSKHISLVIGCRQSSIETGVRHRRAVVSPTDGDAIGDAATK